MSLTKTLDAMNKEFKKYVTDELLLIANNVTGEYTDKQVQQAKLELYNRGVDDKIIADIMEEKEEAFMRRLDAAARAEQARKMCIRDRYRVYFVTYNGVYRTDLLFS